MESGMAPPQQHARTDRRRRRPILLPSPDAFAPRLVPSIAGLPSIMPAAPILAGTIAPVAAVSPDAGNASPSGYTPQQIRAAYGFDQITFGTITGDGAGQTI